MKIKNTIISALAVVSCLSFEAKAQQNPDPYTQPGQPFDGYTILTPSDASIKVYQKQTGATIPEFGGVGIVKAPIARVVSLLENIDLRKAWTDGLLEANIVSPIQSANPLPSNERVEYMEEQLIPGDNSNLEEFIYDATINYVKAAQQVIVNLVSVDPNSPYNAPATPPGVRRGQLIAGLYRLTALPGDLTEVLMTINVNLNLVWYKSFFGKTQIEAGLIKWPTDTINELDKAASQKDAKGNFTVPLDASTITELGLTP